MMSALMKESRPRSLASLNAMRVVLEEMDRCDEERKPRVHDSRHWLALIMEEVGEVAKADLDKQSPRELYSELSQVAGLCISWMRQLNREGLEPGKCSKCDVL